MGLAHTVASHVFTVQATIPDSGVSIVTVYSLVSAAIIAAGYVPERAKGFKILRMDSSNVDRNALRYGHGPLITDILGIVQDGEELYEPVADLKMMWIGGLSAAATDSLFVIYL